MKGNQEGKIQKGKRFKENKSIHHGTQINNIALKKMKGTIFTYNIVPVIIMYLLFWLKEETHS